MTKKGKFAPLPAPFPWTGGKSRIGPQVWERFGPDCYTYIEPCFGSGAMLLANPWGGCPREIVGDSELLLANAWRSIQVSPEQTAYYADEQTSHIELHWRQRWLVRWAADAGVRERLLDPEQYWCDPQAAGYWLYGVSNWISVSNFAKRGVDGEVQSETRNCRPMIGSGSTRLGIAQQRTGKSGGWGRNPTPARPPASIPDVAEPQNDASRPHVWHGGGVVQQRDGSQSGWGRHQQPTQPPAEIADIPADGITRPVVPPSGYAPGVAANRDGLASGWGVHQSPSQPPAEIADQPAAQTGMPRVAQKNVGQGVSQQRTGGQGHNPTAAPAAIPDHPMPADTVKRPLIDHTGQRATQMQQAYVGKKIQRLTHGLWTPEAGPEAMLPPPVAPGLPARGFHDDAVRLSGERLVPWFRALQRRLSRVYVLAMGWRQCVASRTMLGQHDADRATAIFLDPPYRTEQRASGLYAQDDDGLTADAVADWCRDAGSSDKIRIAMCALEGDYDMPTGWTWETWDSKGWQNRGEQAAEIVWYSPGCLRPAAAERVWQIGMTF